MTFKETLRYMMRHDKKPEWYKKIPWYRRFPVWSHSYANPLVLLRGYFACKRSSRRFK